MGWTAIPNHHTPVKTEHLNRIADQSTASPNYEIIDRSGWLNYDHCFLLAEMKPEIKPDCPARRIILTVQIRKTPGEVRYSVHEESEGPNLTDCPLRLLNAAELYPSPNETAARWRQQVRTTHQRKTDLHKLLNRLDQAPPGADTGIVLNNGEMVTYQRITSGGKSHRVYRKQGDPNYYQLSPENIDLPATLNLSEQ